jgi:hypothetical protein
MPRKRRRVRELLGEIRRLRSVAMNERSTASAWRSECSRLRKEAEVSARLAEIKEEVHHDTWMENADLRDELGRLPQKNIKTMTLGDFCRRLTSGSRYIMRASDNSRYQRDADGFLVLVST